MDGPRSGDALALTALRDVSRRDGRFVAETAEPWLLLDLPTLSRLRGRFVEMTYRASLWDEPVRPIIRFRRADGTAVDRIAPGPVVGAGIWTGRFPPGTQRIEISPTHRVGPFDFRIERLRIRAWPALLAEGLRRNPKATRSAILTRLIGWAPESDVNLAWAIGAKPVDAFPDWRARRSRDLEPAGIDAPRFDWTEGETIRLFVRDGPPDLVRRTIASLQTQTYPRWTAVCPSGSDPSSDARLQPAAIESDEPGLDAILEAGDALTPHALAHVAEQSRRNPHARLFYGDVVDGDGADQRPSFLPGWGPLWQGHASWLRGPLFARGTRDWAPADREAWLSGGCLPMSIARSLGADEAIALRRILCSRRREPAPTRRDLVAAAPSGAPSTTVIVPTRDHPALLRRVVDSIRRQEARGPIDIVVVDNGSRSAEALALLGRLAADPDVQRLDRPGPFNFSAMCNAAAAVARGEVLVFLNDDTELLSRDGLARLAAWATTPDVGAVGAKLTYPDGRVQHVGVVVGLGESAAHFGALAEAHDPGWHGWTVACHEVSAVTGACLAVARAKFEAVGGFDAEHLPVELSDIDLCLKLNARRWQTIVDPAVRVMHEESVSRGGATFRRLSVYADQRAVFVERWRHVLRDDPVFHPALSLYSSRPALG